MAEWTALDEISEISVLYLNGNQERIVVNAIICNANAQPLWITHFNTEGQEVIVLCSAIVKMVILAKRSSGINGVPIT